VHSKIFFDMSAPAVTRERSLVQFRQRLPIGRAIEILENSN
jgi:hypothetical protein